ncbi:sulfite exporter TauE/SafE family protein [Kineosporia sp. J2-2]|uniref:Probable membrane transporter protein n=1 Tax=Kineosporia corallincola TaxID=2835133 RepID=A0ABS5TIA5_9ACTN|nr:sulfite exporter TauE/SafE family protein [Kineosporia corallincola]MBT0770129.1 sulfite exporter TauE/SafE family protein [Kineosporia corallincola]
MILQSAPTVVIWLALGTAALCAGFAKTAVGGLGLFSVVLAATVMPAAESTAAVLLLLLVGDACAVARYHRDADWRLIRQVVPAVLPGLLIGAVLLAHLPDTLLRRTIGGILLFMVALQLLPLPRMPRGSRRAATLAGLGAGACTMTANAAGPVMTLYLVARGLDKRRFLGTSAWFFAGVNLCKVPFAAGLGLFDTTMVLRGLALAPVVVLGALIGVKVVNRLEQRVFDRVVLVASGVSALALILL